MSWKQIAQSKREDLRASIPPEWRLDPEEVGGRIKQRKVVGLVSKRISANAREITELSVSRLLQKLQVGDVTASEVVVSMPTEKHRPACVDCRLGHAHCCEGVRAWRGLVLTPCSSCSRQRSRTEQRLLIRWYQSRPGATQTF